MKIAAIIICILSFITLFIVRRLYEDTGKTKLTDNLSLLTGFLIGSFCILLIIIKPNVLVIPKILLYASCCLAILYKEEDEWCIPFWKCIALTVVAFCITGLIYIFNVEISEIPEVVTTNIKIVCVKDNSYITGQMSGGVFYKNGSISEEHVYNYYYETGDGGIKLGTIPAEDTVICYVDSEEDVRLERIETINYAINNNNTPATKIKHAPIITYKLYVPKGSIDNVYTFDAE